MKDIPIILLAAGQSRRMGGADKLLQDVDGESLLRRMALIALQVGDVYVALPPKPHDRYQALDGLDMQKIEIPDAAEGMNASLRGALAGLPAGKSGAMVLLADLPELTKEDLVCVLQSVSDYPDNLIWRGATAAGKPGHPVIFDAELFPELKALRGDEGAQSVVRANRQKVHLCALPNHNALLDLDTPEEWAEWRKNRVT